MCQSAELLKRAEGENAQLLQKVAELERIVEQRDQPSNYTKHLLLSKDMEIGTLQQAVATAREEKWHCEQQVLSFETKVELLETEKVQLQ